MAKFRKVDSEDPKRSLLNSALNYYATYYGVYINPLSDYMRIDDDYCIMVQIDGGFRLLVMEEGGKIFEVIKGFDTFRLWSQYANYKDWFFSRDFDIPGY